MAASIERLTMGSLATAWVEGRTTPMHMALVAELEAEGLRRPNGSFDLDLARRVIDSRLPRAPLLLKELRLAGLGGGGPYWVDAGDFDIQRHVELVELPSDTSDEALLAFCANEAVLPLDRARPLWRMRFVRRGDRDTVHLVIVVHHMVADGVFGMAMLASLLDDAPSFDTEQFTLEHKGEPSALELRVAALAAKASKVRTALRSAPRWPGLARHTARTARLALRYLRGEVSAVPWLRHISPGRQVAVISRDLAELKAASHRHGVTINDLLLESFRAGVRALLRTDDPTFVFRISVPMEMSRQTPNANAMMILRLPVHEADGDAALAEISRTTRKRRAAREHGEAPTVTFLMSRLAASVVVRWLRRFGRRKVSAYLTNIAGPQFPMWLGPAQVLRALPLGPLVAGVGLSVAVLSWNGELNVVLHVDDAFEDLPRLRVELARRLDELISEPLQPSPQSEYEFGASAP